MTDTTRTDTQWIAQLHTGSHEAAQAIFDRYFGKTQRLASRRLSRVNCREADEEDVAISALESFFRGVADNRFPDLCTSNDLWRLLAVITARKAVQQTRRQYRLKRGANAIRGESVFIRADDSHAGGLAESAVAPDNREVEVREFMNSLLDSLDDTVLREIALLKLNGYTNREIAEAMDCVTRTVERKLSLIRDRWVALGFGGD
jgi:DNA-directed RNA polymerase specialized sigma24 family protein